MGGLFGGSQTYTPQAVTYEPTQAPVEEEQEAEGQNVRNEERDRLRRRRLAGGTVLTSPLGATGATTATNNTVLGRSSS